jgi:hypothetical protein
MTRRPNKISDLDWLEYQGRLIALLCWAILWHLAGWVSVLGTAGVWFAWVLFSVVRKARNESETAE